MFHWVKDKRLFFLLLRILWSNGITIFVTVIASDGFSTFFIINTFGFEGGSKDKAGYRIKG
jgi:hypothetical protein